MSDLYAYIHKTLREDSKIIELLGLSGNLLDAAKKIQKKRNPKGLISEDLPIISFYANPGVRGENHLAYMFTMDFDIYTLDGDEELAIEIADRINEIFEDSYLGIPKGSSFKSEFLTMGEVETNQEDTFKYFTQILYTIGIEG